MANSTATVTAKVGPGLAATALALSNVSLIDFDLKEDAFTVEYLASGGQPKRQTFDYNSVTTITMTHSTTTGVTALTITTAQAT